MPITVKRARTSVEFCEDLSLQAEWETATEQLREAQNNPSKMLNDGELAEAAQKVRDIEKVMDGAVLLFELEALPRKTWQELEATYPPREDVEEDKAFDVDVSRFFDAALKISIVGVTRKVDGTPVEFSPITEWDALADEMTDGQYSNFGLKVLGLNRGVRGVPFSQAASRLIKTSDKS